VSEAQLRVARQEFLQSLTAFCLLSHASPRQPVLSKVKGTHALPKAGLYPLTATVEQFLRNLGATMQTITWAGNLLEFSGNFTRQGYREKSIPKATVVILLHPVAILMQPDAWERRGRSLSVFEDFGGGFGYLTGHGMPCPYLCALCVLCG
jgi:hypothetical protein